MNPVKSGNRAISVQTKGQPLAIVAAVTQAPKVMMPTEISSETTLSMVGCSSRLCRRPSGKIAQAGERNGGGVADLVRAVAPGAKNVSVGHALLIWFTEWPHENQTLTKFRG